MHRTTTEIMGWRVETWEQPGGEAASQDAQLVWPDPAAPRLRLAVLDGVTPSPNCRSVAGVAGSMYAAAVARLALQRSGSELADSLLAANRHLHDLSVVRSRDQAQTCVTAADVFPDGSIDVVRAGDCDAWARSAGGWVPLGCGPALRPPVSAALDELRDRHEHVGRVERHAAEERLVGRPGAWTSTALGRFERPVIQSFSLRGVSELVLATDGARLGESALDELPDWLDDLRRWELRRGDQTRANEKLHDDVAVVRLTRGRPVLALAA